MQAKRLGRLGAILVGFLGLVSGGPGCGRATVSGDNSETHFLASCDGICAGGLECVCGVCTQRCNEQSACGTLVAGADASCEDSCDDGRETGAICDVRCATNDACRALGAEFSCQGGRCRSGSAGDGGSAGEQGVPNGVGGTTAGSAGAAGGVASGGAGAGAALPPDTTPPEFDGALSFTGDSQTLTGTWLPAVDDRTPQSQLKYLISLSTSPGQTNFGDPTSAGPGNGDQMMGVDFFDRPWGRYYLVVRAMDAALNRDTNMRELSADRLVSFMSDVQPILTLSCAKSSCHLGSEAVQGLRLEEGWAYAALVNVPSAWPTETNPHWGTRLDRVEPGDPFRSYLWHAITHSAELAGTDEETGAVWSLGQGQPLDTFPTPLPAQELATIRQWIVEGARDN